MYLQLIYEILPMVAYAALSSRYCRGEREKTRKLTRNKVYKKKSEHARTHIVVGIPPRFGDIWPIMKRDNLNI